LLRPIVTGYFVGATGSFDNAFLLTMVRGGIGSEDKSAAMREAH
jgi:hypothetical protein